MSADGFINEFRGIVERVSTVEQFAIWQMIDQVQRGNSIGRLITADVSKAYMAISRIKMMPRQYFDDGTPEIIIETLKRDLEETIKAAQLQKPITMRHSLQWTDPATRITTEFTLPPFFLGWDQSRLS